MANNVAVDTPLLRVPCEQLRASARERSKVLNAALAQAVADATAALPDGAAPAAQEAALAQLEARLQQLKRKYQDVARAETATIEQCRARTEHLAAGQQASAADPDTLRSWERTRLDRRAATHLLGAE